MYAERRTWSAVTTGVALLTGGGLICLLGVAFPFSPSAPEGLIAGYGIVNLALAGGVWLMRHRFPETGLHVLVVVVVIMAAVIVAQARTLAGAMVSAFPYVWIALYVALFFSRRAAFLHAAFIVATLGIALAAGGLAHVVTAWLIASTTVAVAVLALSSVSTQLRRQAEDLRAVMASAAEGIITINPDGRGSFVNRSAARMLGYAPAELEGRVLSGLIVEAELEPGASTVRGDAVFRRKDGTTFPALYASTPLRLDAGGSRGTVLTFTDITDRRQVERMKDELISVVGHELRTPLTSIRGSLGLMAGGVFGDLDDQGTRMLEIAVSNTDRLVRLINDILDIERIEAGQVTMNKVACHSDELVAHAIEAMRGQADTAGVRMEGKADDVVLRADVDRILQTLTNLISNAIKFSPRGGEVRVTAQALPDAVVFGVADRGRGVPLDKQERIFERFGQVDASDAREKGGTGLGLPIARSIVEQHGGRIWIDSAPGEGATFWFTLPAATVGARDGNGDGPSTTAALVVEDDADLASVLRAMLRRYGVEAVVTPSAEEAIALIDSGPPLLLVLDIELIGAEGGTVVDYLREHPEIPPPPVVVYTVHDLSEADRKRLTLGRTLFFTKGRVAPEEFERRVADLLEEVASRATDHGPVR